MYNLEQAGFTDAQVKAALRTNRTVSYGFELLDKNDSSIGEIQVSSCRIYNNSEATIQRSIQLATQNDGDIDYASDRIRPYMRLKIGDTFLKYPMGIFLLVGELMRNIPIGYFRKVSPIFNRIYGRILSEA